MELSRKTRKNLKRLKGDATELWEQQQKVLDQAGKVISEARVKLGEISDAEVRPRIDSAVSQVKPTIDRGVAYTQVTANVVKDRLVSDVLPAVSKALGSAVGMIELARDPRVRDALRNSRKTAMNVVNSVGKQAGKVAPVAQKSSGGGGKFVLVTLGIAAIAGLAWAAYQALRADDDLWLDDIDD